jgi:hypothetical protein
MRESPNSANSASNSVSQVSGGVATSAHHSRATTSSARLNTSLRTVAPIKPESGGARNETPRRGLCGESLIRSACPASFRYEAGGSRRVIAHDAAEIL